MPRLARFAIPTLAALVLVSGCGKNSTTPPPAGAARTYRMGFAANPPRPQLADVLATIDLMASRSEVAIIFGEPPWDSLLAGVTPAEYVARQRKPLADYFRIKGMRVWVYLDPGNGLDRSGESDLLVAASRSITEPAIQTLYRQYAAAIDTLVRPDVMGLAVETNLIRVLSPAPLYAAIRQVANDAAADVRALDANVKLSASVQVENVWGRAPVGPYQGAGTDFADFPFIDILGLSSYPYFVWAAPESLPLNYYSRLVEGRTTPVAITEGGWTSESVAGVTSSPDVQRRYMVRHEQLLDAVGAAAVFQLSFTDFELTSLPPSAAAGILPFSRLGLVDSAYTPKPALSVWDAMHARPRTGGAGLP